MAAKSSTIFPQDFVAYVCLIALTLWGFGSLINEHYVITNVRILPVRLEFKHLLLAVLPPVLFNWYIFLYDNKWRVIVQSIEEEAPEKKKKYIIIAWIIIIAILINYWVVSIYLLKWNYDKLMGI
ncbi:hypothetical protein AAW12_24120 [Sphingobacterium sp. Ag1]|nr:hypothetical protein AAW12_24120 [Sphingobacterium sp. Ag1]